ncbi:MAG: histidinol dehydrogenase [Deltaproteobacteria bacterium]|nr:histidinol dehydrogenase [Deltaproteobacteria bacterium]
MKRIFRFSQDGFAAELDRLVRRGAADSASVEGTVRAILDDVADRGDAALLAYTERFDGLNVPAEALRVPEEALERAWREIPPRDQECLNLAARRIRAFHEHQKTRSWFVEEEGVVLGQRVTPLDSVGLYAPGGTASYPSSVLMNALPAVVAGVGRVVLVSPTPRGEANPHVLAAAWVAGVREVYRIGGAQAVGALAYGTRTVPRVDKIVGPGNIYVATAKRLVYGTVDIDMVAGPSEILVVADGSGSPEHVAADLLSQAEHDELATAVLVTTDEAFAEAAAEEVEDQLARLPRQDTARRSWEERGGILVVQDLAEACAIANRFAPEHLELAVERPWDLLGSIRHAGAIFLGHHTPEALGDYAAGPNHVLPTAGTARFFSPLGVDDFVKRTSVVSFSDGAMRRLAPDVVHLARLEGLEAHARAVELRVGAGAARGKRERR